ncbi:hypothetical protein MPSEU_000691400 [Mayamaea pseudoterrestris]|nr:hypothetical protein MPSEU_000691400 [Mayamaea pseudoterrestris]
MTTMERHGCFVFHVEGQAPVPVRSQPSTNDAFIVPSLSFSPGELLAADLIRSAADSKTSFLRLADGTGWILQQDETLRPLYVESDLYMLVVDHFPAGLTARRHPSDRDDFRMEAKSFRPLEKIYCDKKVTHPETSCNYYRLQGSGCWVFDRKFDPERKAFDSTLLEDHHVTSGMFVYVALRTISIRSIPTFHQDFKLGLDIQKGELVMINIVRDSPHGPWLRLACGTGWVPEANGRKSNFEQVVVESSLWSFRILNHPIGIQLRSHPLDERDEKLVPKKAFEDREQLDFPKLPALFEPETIVECDKRITSPTSGVSWYRVVGTKGWIFDRRNGKPTIETYKKSSRRLQELSDIHWTVEYIRGMAAMIENMQEIRHNDSDHVILFQKGELQIKIWYKIRTVTVFVDRPKQGRIQISRKDCSKEDLTLIMKNPKNLMTDGANPRHPTSPRSAAEFDRHASRNKVEDESDKEGDEANSPLQDRMRRKKTALMKYGARYHTPHVSPMKSMDESQIAIKGLRQCEDSLYSRDSGLVVRVPSDQSVSCSIATAREPVKKQHRPRTEDFLVNRTATVSYEDEIESRQDLLVLEKEIMLLLDGRQRLIDALHATDLQRSEEAQQLQQQSEVILKKLEPLVDPGFAFWGSGFGTWRCDKCGEECSDRHGLSQHVASTGH